MQKRKNIKTKFTKLNLIILVLSALTNTLLSNSFAVDYESQAQSIVNSVNLDDNFSQNSIDQNIPGYEGTNIAEANYYNDSASLEDDSANQLQNDEAGQTVQDTFNNQGDYQFNFDNDPLFATEQEDFDPTSVVDWLSGGYSDCDPESQIQDITINDIQTCDRYITGSENSCQIPRVVEVESNYNYSCTKELTYTSKNCTKNLNVIVIKEELGEQHFSNFPNYNIFLGTYLSERNRLITSAETYGYGYLSISPGDKLYISGYRGSSPDGIFTVNNVWQYILRGGEDDILHVHLWLSPNIEHFRSIPLTIKRQTSQPSSTPLSITSTWEEICS